MGLAPYHVGEMIILTSPTLDTDGSAAKFCKRVIGGVSQRTTQQHSNTQHIAHSIQHTAHQHTAQQHVEMR